MPVKSCAFVEVYLQFLQGLSNIAYINASAVSEDIEIAVESSDSFKHGCDKPCHWHQQLQTISPLRYEQFWKFSVVFRRVFLCKILYFFQFSIGRKYQNSSFLEGLPQCGYFSIFYKLFGDLFILFLTHSSWEYQWVLKRHMRLPH